MIAKSNTAHSNRVEASSPTLSPCATPSAASPLATAVTWSANWLRVTGTHDPEADLYSQYSLPGCSAARWRMSAVVDTSSPTVTRAGKPNSVSVGVSTIRILLSAVGDAGTVVPSVGSAALRHSSRRQEFFPDAFFAAALVFLASALSLPS